MKKSLITICILSSLTLFSCLKNSKTTDAPPTAGVVSTYAGNGTAGLLNGPGATAEFNLPIDIVPDLQGNLFIAEQGSNVIRKLSFSGVVSTYAGDGKAGYKDGAAADAEFNNPEGLTIDNAGNLYVSDAQNNVIRKITPAGIVSTYAGTGASGYVDGLSSLAQFNGPIDVCADDSGYIYVSDFTNQYIRKISFDGIVSTIAGDGYFGFADGIGAAAQFNNPVSIKIDKEGNLIVADQSNSSIRKVTPAGVVTTIAGSGIGGYQDGDAMNAQFRFPAGIGIDEFNNIYIGEYGRIRKLSPDGTVSTVAGSGNFGLLDGDTKTANFYFTDFCGVGISSSGIIYVADRNNYVIRKITF